MKSQSQKLLQKNETFKNNPKTGKKKAIPLLK